MDIEVLIAQLPEMKIAATRARAEGNAAYARAEKLDKAIAGIEGLADESQPVESVLANQPEITSVDQLMEEENDDRPTGIEAVRRVIRESPERSWRSGDVYQILRARGWVSPENTSPARSTGVALHRMAKRGELVKVGRGEFRLPGGSGGTTESN